jgi:hypothetical protein
VWANLMAKTPPMTGSYVPGFHGGSRSAVLADYLFSSWGTVTPVRQADDHGVDLYCTLAEQEGSRAIVTDYYVVQVKSNTDPWIFEYAESVRWLVNYPLPLFLATIDKKQGLLCVYHLMPRFLVAALGELPSRLVLRPQDIDEGEIAAWSSDGEEFSLSAPILRVKVTDLLDDEKMNHFRAVFSVWLRYDRENCDLVRQGVARFRFPHEGSKHYVVNELPHRGVGELGNWLPSKAFMERGIRTLAESLNCLGDQFFLQGDRFGALLAALLNDHLQRSRPEAFGTDLIWRNRVPGFLGVHVCTGLNALIPSEERAANQYMYQGLELAQQALASSPRVEQFLESADPQLTAPTSASETSQPSESKT